MEAGINEGFYPTPKSAIPFDWNELGMLSLQEQVLSRCNDESNVLVVDGINKFLDGYFIGSIDWLSIFVFIFLV